MQKLVFTNGGGNTIDLTSGNFGITNWEGLSGVGLNIQTQQVPFQDGGVFLDALMEQREISVTVAIQDNNDLSARYERKRELISALNPKLGEGVLIYTNDFLSRQIKAVPQLPIFENKNSNDSGTLKASVTFSCPSPYWEDLEETVVNLNNNIRTVIENKGDVECGVKITIAGKNAKNPTINNFTQNKNIGIEGNYYSNIKINTNNGQKSIIQNDMLFRTNVGQYVFNGIVYSDYLGLIICVGTNNGMCKSSDGNNWTSITNKPNYSTTLHSIVYSKTLKKFVVVGGYTGNGGVIYTSDDGDNWSLAKETTELIYSIAYSELLNLFVAVGSNGLIITSVNGVEWETQTSGVNTDLNKIIYNEAFGKYMIVGDAGIILSSSDGIEWTSETSGVNSNLIDITFSEDKVMFIVTSATTNLYLTSSDGNVWESQNTNTMRYINYISELGLFLASTKTTVYGNTVPIKKSEDGLSWEATQQIPMGVRGFLFVKQLNLVFAITAGGQIYASSDGDTWTSKAFNYIGMGIKDCVYVNNYYYGVGKITDKNGYIVRSSNNLEWKVMYTAINKGIYKIKYFPDFNLFIALGDLQLYTSTDGVNWSVSANTVIGNEFKDIIYSEILEKFIVIGIKIMKVSTDGLSWSSQTVPEEYFNNITENNNTLFITTAYKIYKSTDGITWTFVLEVTGKQITDIIYSEEKNCLLIMGTNGLILKSNDGVNWMRRDIQLSSTINAIFYSAYYKSFIGVGNSGIVIMSDDGINWNNVNSELHSTLSCGFEKDGIIYVYGGSNTHVSTTSEETNSINIIENLLYGSDMSFGLNVGNNEIITSCVAGSLIATLSFRQKYIGV